MRAAGAVVCLLAAAPALAAPPRQQAPKARAWDEKRIGLPRVGSGMAYVPKAPTGHVVLLVSGADGWNAKMVAAARRLAPLAVVVGVDYAALKRTASRESGCWYTASDFELISHAAQKTLKLAQYHPPVLVGYGEGGAVVYSALANGPATTFAGGVSVGFCPSVSIGREICSSDTWTPDYDDRRRIDRLPPAAALPRDWYATPGPARSCAPDVVRQLAGAIPKAHFVADDRLEAWLEDIWTEKEVKPPTAQPRSATARELEDDLQKLQLPFEFRWPAPPMTALLLFFSGDGGWASLDEEVAEHLVAHGIGVVGISSLRYFWQAKPPAAVASDIRRVTAVLAHAARPLFAGGFSFGAEVVPVALEGWSAADRRALSGLVLIAPGPSASFEIDPLDWIRTPAENPQTRVAPAIRADGLPTACIAGADEEDSPCPTVNGAPGVRVVRLPGSHHFNSDFSAVGEAVYQFIRATGAHP